jgi:hypothetical protein
MEAPGDGGFQVEASVSGDFYNPSDAPQPAVIETTPTQVEDVTPEPRTIRTPRTPRTPRTSRKSR